MVSPLDNLISTKRLQFGSIMLFMFGSGNSLLTIIRDVWIDSVGIGIWMLLTVSSIIIIVQQHPRRPLWRLTLAFLITTLVVNSAYLGFVEQMAEMGSLDFQSRPSPNDVLPGFPLCSTQGIAASVLSTISVLLNDAFFVSPNLHGGRWLSPLLVLISFSGHTCCSRNSACTSCVPFWCTWAW